MSDKVIPQTRVNVLLDRASVRKAGWKAGEGPTPWAECIHNIINFIFRNANLPPPPSRGQSGLLSGRQSELNFLVHFVSNSKQVGMNCLAWTLYGEGVLKMNYTRD